MGIKRPASCLPAAPTVARSTGPARRGRSRAARGKLTQARRDTEMVGRDCDELAAAQRNGVQSNPQTLQPPPGLQRRARCLVAEPPDANAGRS